MSEPCWTLVSETPEGWMTMGCGCQCGKVEEAFLVEPCSLDCKFWKYCLQQMRAQGKPTRILDMT